MATVGNTPLRHLFGDPLADINAPCQCLVSYQVGNEPTRLTQKVKGRLYVDQTGLHIRGIVPIDLEFRAIKEIGFAHAVCKSELMVRSRMRVYLTPVHCYFGMLSLLNIYHMVHIYSRLHRQVGGKGRCAKCGYNMLMTKGEYVGLRLML